MSTTTTAGVATSATPAGGRQANVAIDRAECERRGCEACGEWFPYALLEWHHVDGRDDDALTRERPRHITNQARAAYLAERELCVCLCPTCHSITHLEDV